MNSKERVLTVLNHKPADRVPITNRYTPEIAAELARIVGVRSQDSFDLEVALGHDMLCTKEIGIVNAYTTEGSRKIGDEYIDDYGIVKKLVRYDGGAYLEIVKNPLENLDAWSSYRLPDPDQQPMLQKQYEDYENAVAKYGHSHAIVGGVTCTIFEGAQMLRGISRLMVDLLENEEFVNELMDQLMQHHFTALTFCTSEMT